MKNSDMPIAPIFNDMGTPLGPADINGGLYVGLTKREYFAGLAMQRLKTGPLGVLDNRKGLVEMAVLLADDLLDELEK